MYTLSFENGNFGCSNIVIRNNDVSEVIIRIYYTDIIPWCNDILKRKDICIESESMIGFANLYANFSFENNLYLKMELAVDGVDHCNVVIFIGKYPINIFDALIHKILEECDNDESFFDDDNNNEYYIEVP